MSEILCEHLSPFTETTLTPFPSSTPASWSPRVSLSPVPATHGISTPRQPSKQGGGQACSSENLNGVMLLRPSYCLSPSSPSLYHIITNNQSFPLSPVHSSITSAIRVQPPHHPPHQPVPASSTALFHAICSQRLPTPSQ